MQRAKRYYVIFEDSQQYPDGEWKVKLEKGRVIRTFGSGYRQAITKAKQLGRRNNRPVMVNGKNGETGVQYYSVDEL
jgi:hypothetical protein